MHLLTIEIFQPIFVAPEWDVSHRLLGLNTWFLAAGGGTDSYESFRRWVWPDNMGLDILEPDSAPYLLSTFWLWQ